MHARRRFAAALAGAVALAGLVGATVPSAQAATGRPHLTTKQHTRTDLPRYTEFRYQTGRMSGVPRPAAAAMDAAVNGSVAATVKVLAAQPAACTPASKPCGAVVITLRQPRCLPSLVCVAQQNWNLPPGANDSEAWMTTFAFDARTGRRLALDDVVPAARQQAAADAARASLQAQLKADGMNPSDWSAPILPSSLKAWLPEPDGVHVWFAKYAVAPGVMGIVETVIPWSAIGGRPSLG